MIFFLGTLGGLPPACSCDECDIGDSYCRGLDIIRCEQESCGETSCMFSHSGTHWEVDQTCEHACIDGYPPFCALSPDPDPRCATDGMSSYCKDAEGVNCLGGYAVGIVQCGETNKACISFYSGHAICALGATQDPDCLALRYSNKLCRDEELITCYWGYITSIQTCCAACVSPRSGGAFCAASDQPDPRCVDGSARGRLECPGGAPAICTTDGYLECIMKSNLGDLSVVDAGCSSDTFQDNS